jgi:hypothetical protein
MKKPKKIGIIKGAMLVGFVSLLVSSLSKKK